MKLLKNRTVLGLLCIAAALLICFVLTPLLNAGMSKKTTIVRFTESVKAGEEVKKSMLQEIEVGAYNLPPDVLRSIAEAEGKYLTADVYAGDYLLAEKVSVEPAAENQYLYHLNGEKQAISITISSFAEGLSGKLKSGDIVSVIAPDYLGSGETVIPAELKYVEVIAVTATMRTHRSWRKKRSYPPLLRYLSGRNRASCWQDWKRKEKSICHWYTEVTGKMRQSS